jgi:hypothetical protein
MLLISGGSSSIVPSVVSRQFILHNENKLPSVGLLLAHAVLMKET